MTRQIIKNLHIVITICFFCIKLNAQKEKKNYFRDSDDGAVDMSNFLNSTAGFLPVPLIITEPAVGYGGGLAIGYFHKRKDQGTRPLGLSPTMSFGVGAATENGTWIGILGHQGSYKEDRYRYTGVLGFVSPNLTYYTKILNQEASFEFNVNGFLTFQEFLFRPKKDIPFFVGANYIFFNNNVTFKTGLNIPELESITTETNTAGLNASFLYDLRDNTFTPTKGIHAALEIGSFNEALGGDRNYFNFDTRLHYFTPVIKNKLFSGYKIHAASKIGDVPFFELPFIDMRGIKVMRYQAPNILTAETEWRWQAYKRWSLVGFIGAGEAMEDYGDIGTDIKVAGGGGFRYFIAKQYGIHGGIDIARGPEDWAWYITVGSNWIR